MSGGGPLSPAKLSTIAEAIFLSLLKRRLREICLLEIVPLLHWRSGLALVDWFWCFGFLGHSAALLQTRFTILAIIACPLRVDCLRSAGVSFVVAMNGGDFNRRNHSNRRACALWRECRVRQDAAYAPAFTLRFRPPRSA